MGLTRFETFEYLYLWAACECVFLLFLKKKNHLVEKYLHFTIVLFIFCAEYIGWFSVHRNTLKEASFVCIRERVYRKSRIAGL